MPYITIKDFRGGLDARKFKLSQPAGTLTRLVNAHITAGAEIEKRKAFVQLANPEEGVTTSLPANTFGVQPIGSGLLVFGSDDQTGNQFPSPFSYQRLQHPAVLAGETYDAAKHAMTAIVHSDAFGASAFAIAKFADGYSFAYYDGALIADFTAGLIMPYMIGDNSKISAALSALINDSTNYTAVQQAAPNGHKTDVFSLPGNLYANDVLLDSVSGSITAAIVDNGVDGVTGVKSTGQFTISAGSASAAATATLTTDTTAPADGATVTINGRTYRFKTTLTASADDILRGGTGAVALQNLRAAINGTGVAGTNYSAATTVNTDVTATFSGSVLTMTAIVPGTAGNAFTLAQAGTTHLTLSGANFTGGTSNKITGIAVGSTYARGFLTSDGVQPAAGDTVSIGSKTYTFRSALTPTEGEVLIGSSVDQTLLNLIHAINHYVDPNGNTNYYCSAAHPQVKANPSVTADVVTVVALTPGVAQNSIATGDSSTHLSWGATTLQNGVDSTQLLLAEVVCKTTLADFASTVSASINNNSSTSGYSATAVNNTVYINSLTANSYSNDASVTVTADGNICIGLCAFNITQSAAGATATTNTLTVDGVDILGGAIGWPGSISQLGAAIASQINAGASGYCAYSSGGVVFLSKKVTSSADPSNTVVVTFSSNNLGVSSLGTTAVFAQASPLSANVSWSSTVDGWTSSPAVTCLPSGGVGPYTFLWSPVAGGDPYFIVGSVDLFTVKGGQTSTLQTVRFGYKTGSNGTRVTQYICTVTDSLGNTGVTGQVLVTASRHR